RKPRSVVAPKVVSSAVFAAVPGMKIWKLTGFVEPNGTTVSTLFEDGGGGACTTVLTGAESGAWRAAAGQRGHAVIVGRVRPDRVRERRRRAADRLRRDIRGEIGARRLVDLIAGRVA